METMDRALETLRKELTAAAAAQGIAGSMFPRRTRLSIGASSARIEQGAPLSGALASLAQPFISVVQQGMPENIWPLRIDLGVAEGEHVSVSGLTACGLDARNMPHGVLREIYLNWRVRSLAGLDDLAREFRRIASLTPPSNRPVQAWSLAHDLMGTPHVTYSGVHARSEAEALLKLEWSRGGPEAIERVIREGGIPSRRNDDRQWFTACELADLDLDPDGRASGRVEVGEEIRRFLEMGGNEVEP